MEDKRIGTDERRKIEGDRRKEKMIKKDNENEKRSGKPERRINEEDRRKKGK